MFLPHPHTRVTIEENQRWKEHFNNTINALNKRTFALRKIAAQIPHKNIIKVVQSLWMSKLRYGLQLCNRVRLTENDPKNTSMMALQVAQNKMLRMMNGSSLKDHITTSSLLEKFNLPSVNQLAAEIKINRSKDKLCITLENNIMCNSIVLWFHHMLTCLL